MDIKPNRSDKKMGRPSKLNPAMAAKIDILARRGFTDKEIAQIVDICEDTITNWKKNPDFFGFLKRAKEYADAIVTQSLYERAVGYEIPEEKTFRNKKGEIKRVNIIKHVLPDVTACIFWLKNRQRDQWGDPIEGKGGL